jgi:hypothetical protein
MLESYSDIRSRIATLPIWFDENGTPRYDTPHPFFSPNIYADEVLFYEIACQSCGARFLVEENWSRHNLAAIMRRESGQDNPSLSERVRLKRIHYGDPPCWACASGATMNCIDIRTVQFWSRLNGDREWARVADLEGIDLDDTDYLYTGSDATQ